MLRSDSEDTHRQAVELLRTLDARPLWEAALSALASEAPTPSAKRLRIAILRSAPLALVGDRLRAIRLRGQDLESPWFLDGHNPVGHLSLTRCRLERVSDLPHLGGVRQLTLSQLPRLSDLSGLGRQLPDLRGLRIEHCERLSDLGGLEGCAGLESLTLRSLHLLDGSALRALTGLQELVLRRVEGAADVFDPGSRFPALRCLTLRGCPRINDLGALQHSAGLRRVHLADVPVASIAPLRASAGTLRGLTLERLPLRSVKVLRAMSADLDLRLDLRRCQLDELAGLERFPQRSLDLRHSYLRSLRGLEGMTSLERLDLDRGRLVDASLLRTLTGLRWLRLPWRLEEASIGALGLPQLTALEHLSSTRWNQLRTLKGLSAMPQLRTLRIEDSRGLKAGWTELRALPALTQLSLKGCPHVRFLDRNRRTPERIQALVAALCAGKTDPRFDLWIHRQTRPSQIPARRREAARTALMVGLRGEAVPVLEGADALATLTMRRCNVQRLDGIEALSALEELILWRCVVSESSAALARCPRLRVLDLRGSHLLRKGPMPRLDRLEELRVDGYDFTERQRALPRLERLLWALPLERLKALGRSPRLVDLELRHLREVPQLGRRKLRRQLTTLRLGFHDTRPTCESVTLPELPALERLVLGPRVSGLWRTPRSHLPALQELDLRESSVSAPSYRKRWQSRRSITRALKAISG